MIRLAATEVTRRTNPLQHGFAPPAIERVRSSKGAETARQRLGLRQSSAAFERAWIAESARGLAQSKTSRKLVRQLLPARWPHGSGSPHVGGYSSMPRCVPGTGGGDS
jgi:hypothetical protein